MSDVTMTIAEREAFLAKPYVGVISIAHPDSSRAPVSAPIWYGFDPAVGVWVLTGPRSIKGKALYASQAFTLVVQDDEPPYRYVSVEGPIVEEREAEREKDLRPLAHRYLGSGQGDTYTATYKEGSFGHVYLMKPRRWLTNDHSKLDG